MRGRERVTQLGSGFLLPLVKGRLGEVVLSIKNFNLKNI